MGPACDNSMGPLPFLTVNRVNGIPLLRKSDVDWLRVMGTLAVFFYHNARFFNLGDWHVKNNELSPEIHLFVIFTDQWLMPLFFLLSGIGTYHSLAHHTFGQFILERTKRLVVPLVFGIVVFLIPVQVYIERVSHGQFSGSFIEFYPEYFKGFYAFGGNFAWMGLHLWYLEVLFVFSLITIPLFALLKKRRVEQILQKGIGLIAFPFGYLIPVLLIFGVEIFNNSHLDTFGRREFGGWGLPAYWLFFICGYIFMTQPSYRENMEKNRRRSLLFGITAFATVFFFFRQGFSNHVIAYSFLRGLNAWAWLAVFIGYAGRYFKESNRFLQYAHPIVMPFYVLHQTVIVMFGFFLANCDMPVGLTFIILALCSFAVVIGFCEIVITHSKAMQFLFGMKRRQPV